MLELLTEETRDDLLDRGYWRAQLGRIAAVGSMDDMTAFCAALDQVWT